jgi:hypothetical protein
MSENNSAKKLQFKPNNFSFNTIRQKFSPSKKFSKSKYAKAVLNFAKLNTAAQQREAVTRGRSLLPYRLRYSCRRQNL